MNPLRQRQAALRPFAISAAESAAIARAAAASTN
jgi:hypothetical protein